MRRRLESPLEIERALRAAEPVRVVLVLAGAAERHAALCERARQAGAAVQHLSARAMARLARGPEREVLALAGPEPAAELPALFGRGGAAWLLAGLRYGANAGFAIRTAEVSGAAGVILDVDFDAAARREALRASIRADRFMPVCWEPASAAMAVARAAGWQVVAVEDLGERLPWEVNLARPTLFVVGGERAGIPPDLLRACDAVVRLPMEGFIPSYNVQAAVAMVTGEWLRQRRGGR